MDVDNISIDGNTVSSTSGDLQLKAVSGSSITFQDDADATKQLTLDFATIGSGTERTWTFPNSDGTFSAGGIASLADDSSPQLGADLDCNGHQIQWSQGADVASGTALAVGTDGNYFDVTGTTTITSINTTGGVGTQIKLHFDGELTLTHDATDLILPGGANITTAAGDEAEFIEYGSGDYRCTNYTRATGKAVIGSGAGLQTIWVPAAAMRPTNASGCEGITDVATDTNKPDITSLDFKVAADSFAQFQIAMPKSWDEGVIKFRVFWTSTATDTDNVDWQLEGVSVPDNSTIDVAYGTAVHVTDANQGAVEEMLVADLSGDVTIASAAADTVTFFRIGRDVSAGTAAEDARLIGVKLFFTTDAENDA